MILALEAELIISVVFLSLLSGLGTYLHSIRTVRFKHSIIHFVAEMTLAVTVGLIVALLCESYEIDTRVTMALVLILSNNSTETYSKFQHAAMTRIVNMLTGGNK